MKKASCLIFLFFQLVSLEFRGQETIGLAEISNYLHEETGAGAQNWEIIQDKRGYLYFANNSGLLVYTNKEWKLFPLPNKTVVRAIGIAGDRIYCGGQDAMGFFSPDLYGQLIYHDLTPLLPKQDRNFGDVWKIIILDGDIYFRTSTRIFRYKPDPAPSVIIYHSPEGYRWSFMGLSGKRIYAQNGKESLVYFNGKEWLPAGDRLLANTLITSIVQLDGDSSLITTLRGGVFINYGAQCKTLAVPDYVVKAQLYAAIRVDDSLIALGTVSKGVYFINYKGEVVRHFSTDTRMQNNNVLSMFVDRQQNLWAGLDEGIDRIRYNSPLKIITPVPGQKLPVYGVNVIQHTLFTATSDGVYACPLKTPGLPDISLETGSFNRIENTEGQTWNISEEDGKILVGHHDGTLLIKGNKSYLLGRIGGGTWKFRNLPGTESVLTGTYAGIQSLIPHGDGFTTRLIPGSTLNESLRFIEIDFARHVLWASHPYRGVYKISFNTDYSSILQTELLKTTDGLPDNLNNFVFSVNNEIVFATSKGIYRYDWAEKKFLIHEQYKSIFGEMPVKLMTSDQKGRIWFVTDRKTGVVDKGHIHFFPELEGILVAGFEYIYPVNDQNIFAGGYSGIIHLNYSQYNQDSNNLKVWMTKISSTTRVGGMLYNGFLQTDKDGISGTEIRLPRRLNPEEHALHFEFTCDNYSKQGKIFYSYRLKGLDNDWAAWSAKSEKDYTNLSYGSYVFEVKAMDNLGKVSAITRYYFEIAPRWYQTTVAYLFYLLLFILMIWGINKLHRKRMEHQRIKFEKDEALLRQLHELELERNEREIIKLKNDHLETEVNFKNKELASTTMHLYKRGRLLGKIKEELSEATQNLRSKDEKLHFNKLLKLIAEEEKRDNDWEQFAIHFDQVHNQFLAKLKNMYPELTPADLKISAYLKMNLSSKEIAQLLNISLKGVEIARYRLRKKLNLDPAASLTDFILKIQ